MERKGGEEEVPSILPTLLNAEFCFWKGKNPNFLKFVCIDCSTQAITKIDKEKNHQDHMVLEAFICTKDYAYHTEDLSKLQNRGLDVSQIAQYMFNKKYHIYPNPRDGSEKQHSDSKCCLTCGHVFTSNSHKFDLFCNFCCILCKYIHKARGDPRRLAVLESCLKNGSSSTGAVVYNDGGKEKKIKVIKKAEIKSRKAEETLKKSSLMMKKNQVLVGKQRMMMNEGKKRKESLLLEETKDKQLECLISELSKVVNNVNGYRKRPRKGIPHRAPLF